MANLGDQFSDLIGGYGDRAGEAAQPDVLPALGKETRGPATTTPGAWPTTSPSCARSCTSDPEIGLDLPRTQEKVLRELDGLGPGDLHRHRTTSVTAVLRGGARDDADPKTVLLRADMDALPVPRRPGSTSPPPTAPCTPAATTCTPPSLIGGARLLAQHRDHLRGDVVLMFQPGEEGWDGAGVMIKEGVLDAAGRRADAAYGMHVFSSMYPARQFSAGPGR